MKTANALSNFFRAQLLQASKTNYNNFEYKHDILYLKKGDKLKKLLSNLQEVGKGNILALSTLKTRYGEYFIKNVILDHENVSENARVALQEPVSNLDEINSENIPMENLPKAATEVVSNVNDVISILWQDEASQTDGLPLRDKRFEVNS